MKINPITHSRPFRGNIQVQTNICNSDRNISLNPNKDIKKLKIQESEILLITQNNMCISLPTQNPEVIINAINLAKNSSFDIDLSQQAFLQKNSPNDYLCRKLNITSL